MRVVNDLHIRVAKGNLEDPVARPIVMITVAAVLGMLPLALGRGIGAELRNSVGCASVGGILVSGILTLVVMPILYDLFTRRGREKCELAEEENR